MDAGADKTSPTTAVRFGFMRYIGEFTYTPEMKFTSGAKVVIQTQRGIELGEQVPLTCTECDGSITRKQIADWVETSGDDTYVFNAGRILREATAGDLAELARIQVSVLEKRTVAQEVADRLDLPIRVVECECPFGGERIIFYFTAAERVDFRGMVKELAREYRTRIEMRQIGARDEARLVADYETCGREVCCKVFLKTLKPISMRMAKVQKATLDPSQVSGRCGRLKCCLRYEHSGYEELDKSLPRVGIRIRTIHGEGVIVNRQIITQLVQIRADDDSLITVAAEDITAVGVEAPDEEPTPSKPIGLKPTPKERPPAEPTRSAKRSVRSQSSKLKRKKRVKAAETGPQDSRPPDPPQVEGQPAHRRRKRRRRRAPGGFRRPGEDTNKRSPPKKDG